MLLEICPQERHLLRPDPGRRKVKAAVPAGASSEGVTGRKPSAPWQTKQERDNSLVDASGLARTFGVRLMTLKSSVRGMLAGPRG
jgi:hypothetical protein